MSTWQTHNYQGVSLEMLPFCKILIELMPSRTNVSHGLFFHLMHAWKWVTVY